MVRYLESVHIGEFLTGTMDEVKTEIKSREANETDYKDPTQTLPDMLPSMCDTFSDDCSNCDASKSWWDRFKHTVDDLIFRSNVHDCERNLSKLEKANKKDRPSCRNRAGKCKARFPRQTFDQTEVDLEYEEG